MTRADRRPTERSCGDHVAPRPRDRARRRRARRLLAAVPRPAAAAAALRRARVGADARRSARDVVDVGFISDAQEGAAAAEKLRAAGCDLIVGFLTTYMTATMLVPVAQRSGAPVLLINLQPTESMDHATFDTGAVARLLRRLPAAGDGQRVRPRCGIPFRSVSGLPGGRAGLGEDRPLGAGGRRPGGAAARPARPDGPPVPGHARRLHRPDAGVGAASAGTSRSWSSTTCGCGSRRSPTRETEARMELAREVFDAGRLGRRRTTSRWGGAGLGRPGPAGRGLRAGHARLLPPRPGRRDARAARRRA